MRKTIFFLWLVCSLFGCKESNISEGSAETVSPGGVSKYEFPFQDPDISLSDRIADLVSRMTLEEKVAQLSYAAPAIDRLGIPEYNWWNECLHGVARNGRATIFPQAIGIAATFDTDLTRQIGEVIAEEARAKFNVSTAKGLRGQYQGLTFWTPNVNIFRDPRWGRGQETYGEDPFLTSRIGVSLVRGLQGDHPRYVKAAGMGKHYAVHNGPEGSRHEFDARVSQKDLWETYLPAFEALVKEAKVEGIMGAYNRTNGEPCCAHPYLMQDVLRKQWGFQGYFVSDCWALHDFYKGHNIVHTPEEAAALALNSGTNLNCGDTYPHLTKAIEMGLTTEDAVDRNLKELLPTRFRLGLMDPPEMVPFNDIGPEVIRSASHVALSRKAAAKSIVLLKNSGSILPVSPEVGSIYVTGPTATHIQALLANYYGVSEDLVTFLEGIVGNASDHTAVLYRQGALLDIPNRNPADWSTGTARESEVTIVCVGISQLIEGEEGESIASPHRGDRVDLKLPPNQIDYVKSIRDAAEKLVLVVTSGSAVNLSELYDLCDALLLVWYPGEQGGNALADVFFGKEIPSGRLPVTIPYSVEDLPPFEDYAMADRTYRYMEKEPMFPFGFGLSYTTFEYSNLRLSKSEIVDTETVTASVTVTNSGNLAAEEVVQLYISDLAASVEVPKYALKGFLRIHLEPGESRTVSFDIEPEHLELVNEAGERLVESGEFQVSIGGSVPSQRSVDLGAPEFEQVELKVR